MNKLSTPTLWVKNKHLLTLIFSLFFTISIYANTVTIGSGTTNSNELPVRVANKYSISQYIILNSQMVDDATKSQAASGNITQIQLSFRNYMGTYPSENRTWKIYMQNTSYSTLASSKMDQVSSSSCVYDGTVTFPATTGWYTIVLTTPFEWNNSKNILLTINDVTGTSVSSEYTTHYYFTNSSDRGRYATSSSSLFDPTSAELAASSENRMPQIKFTIVEPPSGPDAPTSPSATSISSSSATLNWTAAEGADSYEVRYGTTSGSLGDATNVGNLTSYSISGLDASTRYYYQIRTKKGSDYSAWTTETYFNTSAHVHNEITFSKHNSTTQLPAYAGNYYLANNVTLSDNWTPNGNINLCLNGHTVSMGANYGLIDGGITVAIYDEEGGGKITSSNSDQTLLASGNLTNLFIYAAIENTGSGRKVKAASGATASIDDPIDLSDADDNASILAENEDLLVNISMTRSFTSAQYNTICMPFGLKNAQLQYIFGTGYDLEEFVSSSLDGDVLNLVFNKVYSLEAGKPYLLKPSVNLANPSFEGVTIAATEPVDQTGDANISFHATFAPTQLEGGNKNLLFLGADNELFYPASTANIKAFRAYFELKGAAVNSAPKARIVKKQDSATGIENQMVNGKCGNHKFLKDGQLYILREGKMYNVLGMEK